MNNYSLKESSSDQMGGSKEVVGDREDKRFFVFFFFEVAVIPLMGVSLHICIHCWYVAIFSSSETKLDVWISVIFAKHWLFSINPC